MLCDLEILGDTLMYIVYSWGIRCYADVLPFLLKLSASKLMCISLVQISCLVIHLINALLLLFLCFYKTSKTIPHSITFPGKIKTEKSLTLYPSSLISSNHMHRNNYLSRSFDVNLYYHEFNVNSIGSNNAP